MRICLASLHPRRLSGQIESLTALAGELASCGHQVRIVTAFDDDLLQRPTGRSSQYEAGASAVGKLLGMVKSASRLARAGGSADLIHLNLPTPSFSLLADLLRVRLHHGPPIVVGYEAHLADVRRLLHGDYLRRAWRFYLPLMLANNALWGRLASYRCSRYLVASRYQQEELHALGIEPARIVVLPNLIDAGKLRRVDRDDARRALLGRAERAPLVGWCGHYHDVKGVDTLLRAFGRLACERPDLRLVLAWSGIGSERPVETRIRELSLTDHVVRLGRVEVGRFMSALDVLALPYRLSMGQGAFPNMALEAMTVGVPLVTSDLPLLRELVDHEETALLCPPDDPVALARNLARLLDEPGMAAAMVGRQQRRMAGDLSPAHLAARYEALYRDVLRDSGA
jgi:glycosyltransferase involved in cell wall biosynthesis